MAAPPPAHPGGARAAARRPGGLPALLGPRLGGPVGRGAAGGGGAGREPAEAGGEPLAALTPQQQRIARCVAEGATNREVGLRLSLSPRTVDHHLRNVFAALGIRSRTELARLLRP